MSTSIRSDEVPLSMSDEDILAAAESDPDTRPLTPEDFRRMRQTPRVKMIRRALRLSKEEFADRYHLPPQVIEDWESRATEPDEVARAYLLAIAGDPKGVAHALVARKAS